MNVEEPGILENSLLKFLQFYELRKLFKTSRLWWKQTLAYGLVSLPQTYLVGAPLLAECQELRLLPAVSE